jgi:uncharacterized membrane protein YgdD (TMEM256/DUF423 family)
MKTPDRIALSLAAFFGFTAVMAGALGAHALEGILTEREMLRAWETAVLYHLAHAVVLLGLGVWSTGDKLSPPCSRRWATGLIAAGIVLFSGSIYGLALGGPRFLGPVTPLGGLLLLAGWIAILRAAWK